jgi:hypothetical protein
MPCAGEAAAGAYCGGGGIGGALVEPARGAAIAPLAPLGPAWLALTGTSCGRCIVGARAGGGRGGTVCGREG